jgi:hypothetical protein
MIPCIGPADLDVPSLNIGGSIVTPTYAGWVPNSLTGLYQVNFPLPARSTSFTDVNGNVGAITGPTKLPVTVTVGTCPGAGCITSQSNVTMWVAPRLQVVASGPNAAGQVGVGWANNNNVVTVSEGTQPYQFAVTAGLLPSGLSLTPVTATTAQITGTPAANTASATSYAVTVTATDSENIPVSGSTTLNLTIGNGLALSYSPNTLTATVGDPNNTVITTVSAAGGIGPYTYTMTANPSSGTLPAWLKPMVTATSGAIKVDGTQTQGSTNVTITATDATLPTGVTGSINLTLVINPSGLVIVVPGSLTADAGTADPNVGTLSVSGCPTCQFTTTTGHNQPAGVSVATNGIISVDANQVAGTTGTVYVTATNPASGATGNTTFTITINLAVTATLSTAATPLTVNGGATVASLTTVTAAHGNGTYSSYTITAGNLPTGLTISGSGVISGTVSSTATYAPGQSSFVTNATVKVMDSLGSFATIPVSVTVYPLMEMPGMIEYGTTGVAITPFSFTASGGSGNYQYTATMPTGLSLGLTTGQVTGTPTVAAQAPVTVTVTDTTTTLTTTANLMMNVYNPLVMGPQSLTSGSGAISQQIVASGGNAAAYSFTDDGTLEALGLTLSSSGLITGDPNATSVATVAITLTDGVRTVFADLTLNVAP